MNSGTTNPCGSSALSDSGCVSSVAPRPADTEVCDLANLLFFDGVCGLCNRFVNFVLAHDRRSTIRFVPLQGTTARGLVATRPVTNHTDALCSAVRGLNTVVWLNDRGQTFGRSAAVIRVLWQLPGIWKLLGWILWLVPRPLRDLGYRLVASNRYRIFGKRDSCRLPTPEERARFLP